MENLRQQVKKLISENRYTFETISDYIFHHPELGGEEHQSSAYLIDILRREGFHITFPCPQLPTAFVAEYGTPEESSCMIDFLAEYDALPGYGPNGEPAHACGHNWIAAAMAGCGIVLSKLARETNCLVRVVGTPAEETFGAKYDLCEAGVFDNTDAAFQAHLAEVTCLEAKTLAMNTIKFTYYGKAAHAAQFPEKGINALDGVLQLFAGINALRQHVRSDVRMHGIITAGGEAANIVPAFAQCQFSIRANDKDCLKEVRERVLHIAEGAALISGARMEYQYCENPFDDMKNNSALIETVRPHLEEAGIEGFISGEQYLTPGSSDIGNVSYCCPTLYFEVEPGGPQVCRVHEKSALDIVNSTAAYDRMMQIIEGFVMTAVEIAGNQTLKERIARNGE